MNIQFTQGDTVAIPAGCIAEIKDGIITFSPQQEPEQNFKDGDVLIDEVESSLFPHKIIFVYKGKRTSGSYEAYVNRSLNGNLLFDKSCCGLDCCKIRLATEEEKQELFDLMKTAGLRWNAEEKRVEKIRWRANDKRAYYCIRDQGDVMATCEAGFPSDEDKWVFGNYFRTREQALAAAEAIKETLRKFHEEND